jgi:hypothetical protein
MKAWYSSSFDWKTSQLAIGETPSEPLIAPDKENPDFRISVISENQW